MMSIFVDKEMRALIPPLSEEELEQLEENILAEGIRDPLVTWPQPDGREMLIDGHNRFDISCRNNGIPFHVKRMDFPDKEAAKRWIILNQFGRRNLSAYDRSVLALKLKPLIAEQAKENQGRRTDISQKSVKSHDTQKELAKVAGVSHDTIHKVEKIEEKASDRTKQLVREGKLSINQAYNSVHPKRPDPVKEMVKEANREHEEYLEAKQQKTIDFAMAKADKDNQKILAGDLLQDTLKLLNNILDFEMKHKKQIELLSQIEDYKTKKIIAWQCEKCRRILMTVMMEVTDEGN